MATRANALGCGEYEVAVLSRGGQDYVVPNVPWDALQWERRLDDTSSASVTATVSYECCQALSVARPWRHELAIYRSGPQVWTGPLYGGMFAPEQPKLDARDLSAWFDHRRVHSDHDYPAGTDLATIFEAVAADAMAPDNSPGVHVTTSPSGVTGAKQILALQHLMAGPVLRDLANVGIDWTVVVRDVRAGGLVVPAALLGVFLDEHFVKPPQVITDGSAQANDWVVRGAGGGAAGDSVYGEANDTGAAAADGLLESVATNSSLEDNVTAEAAARTNLALSTLVIGVQAAVLAPTAPFSVDDLVPGALCALELNATCVPVNGIYRLQTVVGAATSGGDETITLTFQPAGTT